MNTELQNKLYAEFPELFAQKDLSIQESCMPGGICISDAWYDLMRGLCLKIQALRVKVQFGQVKEKFGYLRVYFDVMEPDDNHEISDKVYKLIEEAERVSAVTCIDCGREGKLVNVNGWTSCLCPEHEEIRKLKVNFEATASNFNYAILKAERLLENTADGSGDVKCSPAGLTIAKDILNIFKELCEDFNKEGN